MTTTVVAVMHDAHVCARATFVAARTAMVQVATARRARAATRAATRATVRATTKVVRAANVVAKEAAEKHASAVNGHAVRVANRAAHKAYCAPAVRAAKLQAAAVAKAVKAANVVRLDAVRATRAAAKATAVVKATMVAIDNGVAAIDNGVAVAPATTVVAPAPVNVHEVVAFLAMTPCLCALWFYATFDIAARAADKEAAKAANKVHARIKAPRPTLNSSEKRAAITKACANMRAARLAAIALEAQSRALNGIMLSPATVAARAAQGAAQRATNEARKAGMPAKVGVTHTPIVRTTPAKNKGVKRAKVWHMMHTVESVMEQVAKKAAIAKIKEDAAIAKARRWALRKIAFANRKEAMEKIAADAWMNKGVWLPEDLLRAANDWSYSVRIGAFKEARAIAYAKAPVATVKVAA